jgi:hypothetical protein
MMEARHALTVSNLTAPRKSKNIGEKIGETPSAIARKVSA